MSANGLATFLLELNVLNVQEIEQHLKQLGARARYPQVKKWLLTVGRKYIINKADEETIKQEYEPVVKRPARRDQYSTRPEQMPDWVQRDMEAGRTIHYFKDIQPRQRKLWQDIEAIIDWFNYTYSPDDPELNRLDRVSFDQARDQARTWNSALLADPWKYVRDIPPVMMTFPNKWRWVQLTTDRHAEREGKMMSHCVGGSYLQSSDIYSLRDPENVPHITMEVDRTTRATRQVKGKTNKKPDPEYQPYIRPFLTKMGITPAGDSQNID